MADDDREDEPRSERRRFRLGEQLTGLLDPEAALRRGQGLVTGVTQATKDELMRIVSSEVRSFLDKMDAADLLQQIIAGLVVDVQMQIRFSKAANGTAQPEITRAQTSFRAGKSEPRAETAKSEPTRPEPTKSESAKEPPRDDSDPEEF